MAAAHSAAPLRALGLAAASALLPACAEKLASCELSPTYTRWKCKPGHEVACWSSVPSAEWACFTGGEAAEWGSDPASANTACKKTDMPIGLGPAYYEAACRLPPSGLATTVAPLRQNLMMPHVTTTPQAPAPLATPATPPPTPPATTTPKPALASPPPLEPEGVPEPLSWDEGYTWAEATLAKLSEQDKYSLMRGVGYDMPQWWNVRKWWYVGNTVSIESANVPSLNMQDAGGGFHTTWGDLVGTVTCWPSMLSAAATWDPRAVLAFAAAVGEEFAGKGANVILGPGVDVSRVARNGRNFEYLSGEDPYLGSVLARSYVRGVQSKGVAAVMKHWVFNVQETNRESESSVVDEKTAWQLYYPPFQAAVDAGVSAAMCSYNKISGVYSCSNEDTLKRDLKGKMGFKGFVQSDWWAVHDMSAGKGLDQEMPGTGEHVYFDDGALDSQDDGVVDDAAKRVLAAIHRLNLTKSLKCSPPDCEDTLMTDVTSEAHTAMARRMATESVVMLKNQGDVLPLSSATTRVIAVCGQAADAEPFNPNGDGQGHGDWATGDYYSGGGSGHVVATNVVKALDGIKSRAKADGIDVLQSPSNSADECRDIAGKADVVLVVAGTTSGESRDRENLHLDDNADELIEAAGKANSKTVVLVQAPGAVVMPWHESAAAILVLFLGGQETGSAWGAVLFGDHAPTGRLPLMIPRSEDDTIAPSDGEEITYTEGLLTSYRNPDLDPLFPFGHGLTYSTFKYGAATSGECSGTTPTGLPSVLCIQVSVENEGPVPARCIPQLYVEFPSEAGYSAPILRGFQRSELLEVGASATVTFALSRRDLSHWDVDKGDWAAVSQVTAHIGESSGDIRQTLPDLDVAGATASQPQARSDPYDCAAGFSNWQAGWSDGKKSWCCEHAQKGCEQPAEKQQKPPPPPAGCSRLCWRSSGRPCAALGCAARTARPCRP
mmetsp:Transcript_101706/g.265251  ORF Transcript_101706/g.265251 Transcript_101706/m.265251 type:complete len:947 (+) Transcript_101706:44-2884(+)